MIETIILDDNSLVTINTDETTPLFQSSRKYLSGFDIRTTTIKINDENVRLFLKYMWDKIDKKNEHVFIIPEDKAKRLLQHLFSKRKLSGDETERCKRLWSDFAEATT